VERVAFGIYTWPIGAPKLRVPFKRFLKQMFSGQG
jgi:hypothetical protein